MSVKRRDQRQRIQSQNWCFTLFAKPGLPIETCSDRLVEITEIDKTNIAACAYGLEVCPKTQRQHLQGFLQLYKKGKRSLGAEVPV